MRLLRWITLISLVFLPLLAQAKVDRFQELFIWKMSEALELDAKKEAEFGKIIRDLNQNKTKSLRGLQSLTQEMAKTDDKDKAKDLVQKYEKQLSLYQSVNQEEIRLLREIFNPVELSKYLSYKGVILEKLHSKLEGLTKDQVKAKDN
tara:strand:- start:8495 stop:8938 length:444 start_codon:yes stop_codon:yes gene_type:complete